MWHIFEKRIVQRYQKWHFHVSNMQIQKYEYTNTQIHKYSIWRSARKTQHVPYFWKEDCSRISKIIFLCVKQYKTQIQNTQIQHITKCQKHPTYRIFLKRGLFKDITNDIPICQTGKYKNASTQIHKYRAYNKMTEKNMWHIFETVVQ